MVTFNSESSWRRIQFLCRASAPFVALAIAVLNSAGCGSQESLYPSLDVREIHPHEGPSTASGTVDIGGRAFTSQVQVTIGGVAAPNVEFLSSRRIRVQLPSLVGRIGLADVRVQQGVETTTRSQAYRVYAEDVSFDSYRSYQTGLIPVAGALGDLDQNGSLDLAVATDSEDGYQGSLVLLLASSAGEFDPPLTIQSPIGLSRPAGIAVADLDRDGLLDIVLSDFNGDQVLVFRNARDARFPDPIALATGSSPAAVMATDVNGDGAADIVVANFNSSSLTIYLADPGNAGTFSLPVFVPVGDQPTSIAAGDLNGDGVVDLAVANTLSGTISLLLGTGRGGFSRRDLSATSQPRAVQIFDVDGDGRPDLLYLKTSTRNLSGILTFLKNTGGANFAPAKEFAAGGMPSSLATGDFNADGQLDVAVADRSSSVLSVFFGSGDPNTVLSDPATSLGAGRGGSVVLDARLNADERPDLVVLNENGRDVSVLFGREAGLFTQPASAAVGGPPGDLIAADVDGDGVAECVVALGAAGVASLQPTGFGGFANPVVTPIPGSPALLAQLPSGTIACVGSTDGVVRRLTPTQTGTFSQAPDEPPLDGLPDPAALLIVDANADGRPDLIVGGGSNGFVRVLLSNAEAGYEVLAPFPAVNACSGLAAADWNGDGHIDLAVGDAGAPRVSVCFGLGDGEFAIPPLSVPLDAPATALVTLGGRGGSLTDLLVGEAGLGRAQLLVATGTGGFTAGPTYALGSDATRFVVADWNFDGRIDFIAVQPTGNKVTLYLGQADGTFASPKAYGVGAGPSAALAFNLNGALPLDLVVANREFQSVSMLTNLAR